MTLTMRRFFYFSFAFIAWFQSYNPRNNSFNYGNPLPIAVIPVEPVPPNGTDTGSNLALTYPGGYIIAEADAGLSNRLRVLAAYMYIAQANYNGANLVFAWDVNSACPGHFLEIFQPIPNLIFLHFFP